MLLFIVAKTFKRLIQDLTQFWPCGFVLECLGDLRQNFKSMIQTALCNKVITFFSVVFFLNGLLFL